MFNIAQARCFLLASSFRSVLLSLPVPLSCRAPRRLAYRLMPPMKPRFRAHKPAGIGPKVMAFYGRGESVLIGDDR